MKRHLLLIFLLSIITTGLQAQEAGSKLAVFPIHLVSPLTSKNFPDAETSAAIDKLVSDYNYFTVIPSDESVKKDATIKKCRNYACATTSGKKIGADYALLTDMTDNGGTIYMQIQLIDVNKGTVYDAYNSSFPTSATDAYLSNSLSIMDSFFVDFLELPIKAKYKHNDTSQDVTGASNPEVPDNSAGATPDEETAADNDADADGNTERALASSASKKEKIRTVFMEKTDWAVASHIFGNTGVGLRLEILEYHFHKFLFVTPLTLNWQKLHFDDQFHKKLHWSLLARTGYWYEEDGFGFRGFVGLGYGNYRYHVENSAGGSNFNFKFSGLALELGFNIQFPLHNHFAVIIGSTLEFPVAGSYNGSTTEIRRGEEKRALYRPAFNGVIGLAF